MDGGKELTPMMRQFRQFKEKYPDALLLFRCGDFYETYGKDAVEASAILGITLTRRNKVASSGSYGSKEMAGFPHHALDTYLPRLVRAGRRVAICDQLEDPKFAKKIVKRGITELVTPGTVMGDNMLTYKENNFLAALNFGKTACGVAFLDISTGEFLAGEGNYGYVSKLLANFEPKELLYERGRHGDVMRHFGEYTSTYEMDDYVFTEKFAAEKLLQHFQTHTLKGFGVEHLHSGIVAAGAVLHYLEATQHTNISHITKISRIDEDTRVRLDKFTLRSLEILSPMQEGGASLLDVIDKTVSPMGGRLLRRWIAFPLRDERSINERLDIIDSLFRKPEMRSTLDESLRRVGDIERIAGKVAVGRVSPREMIQLRIALEAMQNIKAACPQTDNVVLKAMGEGIDLCDELRLRIAATIEDNAPQSVSKGGVIRKGVDAELDDLRHVLYDGKDYLLKIQQRESEATGITSLKIGFNNVFGYYLEVRNAYKDKVPGTWIRKQTLAQAERYITEELKEYEEKILGAEEKILAIEARLWADMVTAAQKWIPALQNDANILARIDCLLSMNKVAEEHNYVRPTVDNSNVIDIRQGRHPVIETQLPIGETYVPNDVRLDTDKQQILIITGPNMAGKSALLRQTALIVLMAQAGSYVPAQSASIGIADRIFTRVGASDNIALGESTFMVEMTEAANIINNVTEHSLVLFDELGRGTSTYDGISIAWAIVEYLHENPRARARTLFATHYHELNEMEKAFRRIRNFNVSVKETEGKVIFLRRLERGGSEHSFGIHVAQMAGMPRSIVKRAGEILRQLEASGSSVTNGSKGKSGTPKAKPSARNINISRDGFQLSFFQLDDPVLCQVRDEIIGLDINNLTPVEALNKLNDIKKIVTGR